MTGDRTDANYACDPLDWTVLRLTRANALLVGPSAMAESVVAGLCALDPPVVTWRPGCDTRPPTAGTVVVPCVDMLDSVQQCRLLAWVGALGDVRILSLASRPIYPLVQSGAFLDALYYRLNVVYVELTPSVSPA